MFRMTQGTVVEFRNKTYVVAARLADSKVRLQNYSTGAVVTLTDAAIGAYHERRELRILPAADLPPARRDMLTRELPEKFRKCAERAKAYVDEYMEHGGGRTSANLTPMIATVAARLEDPNPPSWRTVRDWITTRERAGTNDARLYAPAFHRRGNFGSRQPLEYLRIQDEVLPLYLTRGKPTKREVYDAVVAKVIAHNKELGATPIKIPSYRTVCRSIDNFNRHLTMAAREGRKAADRKFCAVQKGPEPTRPGERVQIDHAQANLFLIDLVRNLPLGRPWITAVIDLYSRAIIGILVSFTPPSAETAAGALRNALLSKHYVKELYPSIKQSWDMFGAPELVLSDNGPEFHSTPLERSALTIGFQLEFAPVETPWFKGVIERWIGTLNTQLLHRIPGTTFANVTQRGDSKPEVDACMSYDAFVEALHKYIIEVYNQSPHLGVMDVPAVRWKEGVDKLGGLPVVPMEGADELIGGHAWRTVRRGAIEINGHFYNVGELPALATEPNFKNRVEVRYDPADISEIFVKDVARGRLVRVGIQRHYEAYARKLPLYADRVIRAHARETMKGRTDVAALAQAKAELQEMIDRAFGGRRRISAGIRAARFQGVGAKALAGRLLHVTEAARADGSATRLMDPERVEEAVKQPSRVARRLPDPETAYGDSDAMEPFNDRAEVTSDAEGPLASEGLDHETDDDDDDLAELREAAKRRGISGGLNGE